MMLYLILIFVSGICMNVCNGDLPESIYIEEDKGHDVPHMQSTTSTDKFFLSAKKTEIQTEYPQFKNQSRLPKFAIPRHYDIRLKPDLIALNFSGLVSINVDVVSATKFLVLNSKNLTIDSSSVSFKPNSSAQALKPVNVGFIEEDAVMVIEFGNELPFGGGDLNMSYQGPISTGEMMGLYRSNYTYNGEKLNMAVTNFEATGARRCFPCWDEPAAKATFKMTLEVPSDVVALSNMPALEEKKNGDTKTVYFQESPLMSTYLVAVAVAKVDYVESRTSDGIPVRCYTQFGMADQAKFSLDIAVKSLDLFRKYFNMPYSLPKMDIIAVAQFPAGGMENYGLVTIREPRLLVNNQTSLAAKKHAAITLSHEMAHQWFGNLVTMEWWTHIWLNEGFATWASYTAVDIFFPEWNMWAEFLNPVKDFAYGMDGLSHTHPIEVELYHADEVMHMFDGISYNKGSSVVQMLQTYVGADTFQRALVSYIKTYAHSNAKTEDLWAVIEKESGEPITQLMSSWTLQNGHPVVSVKIEGQKLVFEQSRFFYSGSAGEGQWVIPVTLSLGSYNQSQNFLLKEKVQTIDVKDTAWIKLNVNQTGFYRVKYDEILEAKLHHAIERQELSPFDRYGILDDSYALCISGKLPLANMLSLMWSVREETDNDILSKFLDISTKFVGVVGDAIPDRLKHFFITVFERPAGKFGWDPKPGEDEMDASLRGKFLTVLAQLGHENTLNEATRRFNAFCADKNSPLLPPNIRKAAYVAVMQKATASNKAGYEALLKLYRETNQSDEKTRIISSLPLSPDPSLVFEALKFLLSSEVGSQDLSNANLVSWEGRDIAWKWFQANYDLIIKKLPHGFGTEQFITGIISLLSSEEKAKEAELFFSTRTTPEIESVVRQGVEWIRIIAGFVQAIIKDTRFPKVLQDLLSSTNSSCPVTPPV